MDEIALWSIHTATLRHSSAWSNNSCTQNGKEGPASEERLSVEYTSAPQTRMSNIHTSEKQLRLKGCLVPEPVYAVLAFQGPASSTNTEMERISTRRQDTYDTNGS